MQGVEPLLPQDAVLLEPGADLGEWLWSKRVDPPLRVLAYVDEPGLAQHAQVSRDTRARNRQQRRQVARGGRALCQGLDDGAPALVGQRAQRSLDAQDRNNRDT